MNVGARARLGSSEVEVTRFGLGTAPLGALVDDETATSVLRGAWQRGVRFFDTAPLYGSGLAEHRTGAALRAFARESLVVATKVGRVVRPRSPVEILGRAPPLAAVFDFGYDAALRSHEQSLDRLSLDRVDVALIHDPDDHYEEALAGAYRALIRLRDEGAVRAIGVGMNQAELLCRFAREGEFDCFLLAGRYTLLDTVALQELLPLCQERGISIIAAGVFNSGVLAAGATYDYAPASQEVLERVARLRDVCGRWDVPLHAAAVQFPLAHPAVACVVVGCRSCDQLDEDLRLFERPLPAGLWEDLKAERLLPDDAPVPAARRT